MSDAWQALDGMLLRLEARLLERVRQTPATPDLPASPHYLRREDVEPLLSRAAGEAATQAPAQAHASRVEASAWARLVERLALNTAEQLAVSLALLVALRPELRPVIAYLQDDLQAREPRVGLVMELLEADPGAPESPWTSLAAVTRIPGFVLRDASSFDLQVLHVAPALVRAMLGRPQLPRAVCPWLAPPVAHPGESATRAAARWREQLASEPHVVAQFVTTDAAALHAALSRGCAHAIAFDPTASGAAQGPTQALREAVDHAILTGGTLSVGPIDPTDTALLAELLSHARRSELELALLGPALLDTRTIRERRPVHTQHVRSPGYEERVRLWAEALPSVPERVTRELSTRYAMGASLIEQAARIAAHDPREDALAAACREVTRAPLGDAALSVPTTTRWSELVLPLSTSLQLRELVEMFACRELVHERWQVRGKLAGTHGICALFFGPPGTGKTLAASAIAGTLGLPLLRIDLAGLISKYIGETEKNLRKVFCAARRSNAVLFFDEADAVFGKRTAVKDAHDRHANVQVSYLLQEIEAYDGIAVLATNFKVNIDEAFLRRMDMVVSFPKPRVDDRRRLWSLLLPSSMGPIEPAQLDELARFKLSGGNIRNVIQTAAFLAAPDACPPTLAHLHVAILGELAKIGRPQASTELWRGAREAAVVQQQVRWRLLLDGQLERRELEALARGFELRDESFRPALGHAQQLAGGGPLGLLEVMLGCCRQLVELGVLPPAPAGLVASGAASVEELLCTAEGLGAPDPQALCQLALAVASPELRARYRSAVEPTT